MNKKIEKELSLETRVSMSLILSASYNKIETLDPCLVNSRREIPLAEGMESPYLSMAK